MPILLQLVLVAVGLALLVGAARRTMNSGGRPVTESALRKRAADVSLLNWFAVLAGYGVVAVVIIAFLDAPDPWPKVLGYGGGVLALLYLGSQFRAGWKAGRDGRAT